MKSPFAAMALLACSTAHALMDGQPVTLEHMFPTASTLNETLADSVIVGPGIEGETFDAIYSVDVSDCLIRVTQLRGVNWSWAPFNGLHLYAPGVTFSSVVVGGSDFQAWWVRDDRMSFDAHDVWLDFAGLSVLQGETLTVRLNPPNPVPEPSTASLAALGATILLWRFARLNRG